MTYAKALDIVLELEGGYANHPSDPGGATYRGVTQRTYDAYRKRQGLASCDVRNIDVPELQAIYKTYWLPICQEALEKGYGGLALTIFDMSVNAGPGNALKLYRPGDTAATYSAKRIKYYQSLNNWSVFGKGWTNRVMHIMIAAEAEHKVFLLAGGAPITVKAPLTVKGVVINPIGDKVYIRTTEISTD